MNKKKKSVDPDYFEQKYIPKAFKLDHCYRYPWGKKGKQDYLCFLINLYAPSKGGYVTEKEKKMWREPQLILDPEKAYKFQVAPQDVWELTLRRQSSVPKYYIVVLVPFAEAKRWYMNNAARGDQANKINGEIIYF